MAGKAKQKNVPKESDHVVATEPNEARVFLDIMAIKKPEGESESVYKPNWRIVEDERTQMKFSDFFMSKNGMAEPTCELFQRWKDVGREVRYLRMDNAGKNKLLQSCCESADWKFRIQPEYTASYTPQQNHLAELGFAILSNRGRALMTRANVPLDCAVQDLEACFQDGNLVGRSDRHNGRRQDGNSVRPAGRREPEICRPLTNVGGGRQHQNKGAWHA
jgi:hypothetical protein